MVRFHAPTVDEMPDAVLVGVIAHELAHVYQYGRRWGIHPDEHYDSVEEEADCYCEEWGIDLSSEMEWRLAYDAKAGHDDGF